jgi:uncharacterized membrane protein required for colicin V production
MNWLDVTIVLGVVLGALIGFQRGFGGMLLRLVGFTVVLIVAALAAAPVAAWVNDRWAVRAELTQILARNLRLPAEVAGLELLTTPFRDILGWLPQLGLPPALEAALESWLTESVGPALARGQVTVGAFVYETLARVLLTAGCFFVVFIAGWAVAALTIFLMTLPLRVGGIDRLLGAALGAAEYALLAAVFLSMVAPWLRTSWLGWLEGAVAGSRLAPRLIDAFYGLTAAVYRFRT